MEEKTSKILLIILAVLLAASIFLNGWLLHERITQTAPENIGGDACHTPEECWCSTSSYCSEFERTPICCKYDPCAQYSGGGWCLERNAQVCTTPEICQKLNGQVL